ncbi:MAG: CPBP family glutamic-type intramembrane protease [Pseudonocardiaceae bacterium]
MVTHLGGQVAGRGGDDVIDGHAGPPPLELRRTGYLWVWPPLWFAALMAAQVVREAFVFVPGFVPWDGESRRGFVYFVGVACGFVVIALCMAISTRNTSMRTAVSRLVDSLGLRPVSIRQALRWGAIGLASAVAMWATAQLLVQLPGLTSVSSSEDPRTVAVAQTSTLVRFSYGLLAPAPLEELFFRAPLLVLWLALLKARRRGTWWGRPQVRWCLAGIAIATSTVLFASLHALGGSANVAHAAIAAVAFTAITLWQRSLLPALAAHALYDAYAFAWG